MTVDTSALEGWASPTQLSQSAQALAKHGQQIASAVTGLETTWKALHGNYHAPEAGTVLSVFGNITPHGEAVRRAASDAQRALENFATGVQGLAPARAALLEDVFQFEQAAPDTDVMAPGFDSQALAEMGLVSRVASLAEQYAALEQECVAALAAINGAQDSPVAPLAGPNVALVMGTATNYKDLYTFTSVEVPAYRTVPLPWQSYRFTPLDPLALTAAERAGDRYLVIDGREVSIHSPNHPDYRRTMQERYYRRAFRMDIDWRPGVNERMYNLSESYRGRVDANRSAWRPDLAATDKPSLRELPGGLKALKIGGAVATVAMTGVAYTDERATEYGRLLAENPSMSEADRNSRATEVAAVKTAARTGVDLGAGMAGAAIGTAIGGPVGTVVGFGVGLGISYVSSLDLFDGQSASDIAAEAAVDLYDGAKDLGNDAVDAVSGAWNSLFG